MSEPLNRKRAEAYAAMAAIHRTEWVEAMTEFLDYVDMLEQAAGGVLAAHATGTAEDVEQAINALRKFKESR